MQPTGERWRLGHRPALDGLRGIAVLLVLANHGGYLSSPAGAVGVTLFFALSGFLITRLIVEARDEGRWSARSFYWRRLIRLGPALMVLVVATGVMWAIKGLDAGEFARAALPAVSYTTNFVHPFDPTSVFSHTWSLAVEEQFYLLWPLALGFVPRDRWVPFTVAGIMASIALRLGVSGWSLGIAYASLPTNAYAMLLGCALALRVDTLPSVRGGSAWLFGFLFLAGVAWTVPSSYIVAPVLAALLATVVVWSHLDKARGVLASRPLRFVGRISYALYLWHWPMLWLFGTFSRPSSLAPLAVAFVCATVSTFLVEEPIRRWALKGLHGSVEPVQHALTGPGRGGNDVLDVAEELV